MKYRIGFAVAIGFCLGVAGVSAQRRTALDATAVARFDVDREEGEKRCGHLADSTARMACMHQVYERIVIFSEAWLQRHPSPDVCVEEPGRPITCISLTRLRDILRTQKGN